MKDVNVNTVEKDVDLQDFLEGDKVQSPLVAEQQNAIREYDMKQLDLKSLGLTEADMGKIQDVKKSFGEVNTLTIADYGKGISSRSAEYTKELLSLVQNKDLGETGTKLNQVITVASELNGNNLINNNQGFLAKLPVVGGMFRSVAKAKQNFEMKFADTNKQIENLVGEIEVNQQGLRGRVEMLDKMFDAVCVEQKEIGIYIASGQLMMKEIQDELRLMTNHDVNDQTAVQRVYDLNHLHNSLEKRLHDLYVLQQSSIQMLPQIRIIQTNNQMLVDKFHAIKNITIPAWKNQISLAISLTEQQNSVDLANTIDEATNSLLKRNADMLHTNSVKTAKAMQRSVIDANTLQYVQNKLIATVTDVIKIQEEGVKGRQEAMTTLKNLQDNYKKLVVDDTVQKITMN